MPNKLMESLLIDIGWMDATLGPLRKYDADQLTGPHAENFKNSLDIAKTLICKIEVQLGRMSAAVLGFEQERVEKINEERQRQRAVEAHLAAKQAALDDQNSAAAQHEKFLRSRMPGSKSESPIEETFLASCCAAGITIEQQVQIGNYRVDILHRESSIVVELDGHEHHKSKQQRKRDAEQGRYLTRMGFRLLRFTGSEICADPQACVLSLKDVIQSAPRLEATSQT